MNDQTLGLLDGDYTTYLSDDSVETEDDGECLNFIIEFFSRINPPGTLQHRLRLKVRSVVMLLRNLNTKKGVCDGNKLVISSMQSNVIEAKLTGKYKNIIENKKTDAVIGEKRKIFGNKLKQSSTVSQLDW
nr:unnamed protein product [Callosobruchus analis]